MNKQSQFGWSRRPAKSASVTYLAPKDLPAKGINYHINHLRRMWSDGRFPKPDKLSPRKIVWDEKVIDEWLAAKSNAA